MKDYSKLSDGAKFCSNCGAKVASPEKAENNAFVGDSNGLPLGMTRTSDGKIRWSFILKKDENICYLDDEKITVLYEIKRKKRSAFGSFLLDAAEMVAMESDNYNAAIPLPSDLEGDEIAPIVKLGDKEYNRFELRFRSMSVIKEDKKNGVIKVYSLSCWWTLCLTPEQYDYVLNYILVRCPNIKRK